MLEDGTYDAVVVDADDDDGVVVMDLAVLSGPQKGSLITVRAEGLARDPIDLLAVPAVLTVTGGEPRVQLEG